MLALQKDGFILLLSICPSVRMSAHTNVNILCQSFEWSFFSFAYIFWKLFIYVVDVWLMLLLYGYRIVYIILLLTQGQGHRQKLVLK